MLRRGAIVLPLSHDDQQGLLMEFSARSGSLYVLHLWPAVHVREARVVVGVGPRQVADAEAVSKEVLQAVTRTGS